MKDNIIACRCFKCRKWLTPKDVTEHFESDPYEEGAILLETGEVRCDTCEEEVTFYEEGEEAEVLEWVNMAYLKTDLTELASILNSYNEWIK